MATLAQSDASGVKVLRLAGSLSQDGVESIRSRVSSEVQRGGPVVIDLSGVDMIYTPGITLLLSAHGDIQRNGGRLVISGARAMVSDVLRRCLLDRVLTLVPEPDDAIKRAREAGA